MKQKKRESKEKKKTVLTVRVALDLPRDMVDILDGLAVHFGSTRKKQGELLLCRKAPQVMAELKQVILGKEYCMTEPQLKQKVEEIVMNMVPKPVWEEKKDAPET